MHTLVEPVKSRYSLTHLVAADRTPDSEILEGGKHEKILNTYFKKDVKIAAQYWGYRKSAQLFVAMLRKSLSLFRF